MSNRFKVALQIQKGASNPRPISAELVKAIAECYAEDSDPASDPAVFLILHQLTWVLTGRDVAGCHEEWAKATEDCKAQAEVQS